jgi:uncharacterized protein YidB (DUF937 family)
MNPFDALKTDAGGLVEKFTGENPKLLQETLKLVQSQPDGIGGLLKQFQDRGLGKIASSWLSGGAKEAISPEQILHGFGADKINALATACGIDPKIVSQLLTTLLPKVFEQLAPAAKLAGLR